jgi:hypothetical protein
MIVPGELLLKNGALPNEPPKDGGAEGNELDKWISDHSRETEGT